MSFTRFTIVVALFALAFPALAGSPEIAWNGWGVRLGLADDPDQVLGGVHFNLGEFVDNLRLQPNVQLGAGDDFLTLFATAPVYYRFETGRSFTPYAGGGVVTGWVDDERRNDADFEIGFKATGGMEWPQKGGDAFFVELSLGFGDVHDVSVIAAWAF